MNLRTVGALQILASGACFGLLGLFGKLAFERGLTPGELLSLRFLAAALVMATVYAIFDRQKFFVPKKELLTSLGLGVLGYAVFSSCYFTALKGLSSSLTVLLLYLYPLFVTLASAFLFKEPISKQGWWALLISTIGLVGLVWGEWAIYNPIDLLFGLGAAFFYGLYVIISQRVLKGIHPLSSSFYTQLGAGVTLFFVHFSSVQRPLEIIENYYLLILSMAFVCSILAMTLFLYGIQKLKSSEASILSMSEPFFGVVIALVFLNEKMSLFQVLGALLVGYGIYLIVTSKKTEKISA